MVFVMALARINTEFFPLYNIIIIFFYNLIEIYNIYNINKENNRKIKIYKELEFFLLFCYAPENRR